MGMRKGIDWRSFHELDIIYQNRRKRLNERYDAIHKEKEKLWQEYFEIHHRPNGLRLMLQFVKIFLKVNTTY